MCRFVQLLNYALRPATLAAFTSAVPFGQYRIGAFPDHP